MFIDKLTNKLKNIPYYTALLYLEELIFTPLLIIMNIGIASIFILLLLGVIIGTHFTLFSQILVIGYFVWFLHSWQCRQYELGIIIIVVQVIIFFVGMLLGDISYMIQTGDVPSIGMDAITSLFIVN